MQEIKSMQDIEVGQIVDGTVKNITSFGAFINFGIENDGLVHISEISNDFIHSVEDVLTPGETYKFKVIEIDTDRNRVGLSMKDVEQN